MRESPSGRVSKLGEVVLDPPSKLENSHVVVEVGEPVVGMLVDTLDLHHLPAGSVVPDDVDPHFPGTPWGDTVLVIVDSVLKIIVAMRGRNHPSVCHYSCATKILAVGLCVGV